MYESFVELVAAHAATFPDRTAVIFSADPTDPGSAETVSYGQLAASARSVGALLGSRLAVGDRVLLLYEPGLRFCEAFLGTLYAGVVAVAAPPPDGYQRQRERLSRIVRDSDAAAVLTDRATEQAVRVWTRESGVEHRLPIIVTDGLDLPSGATWTPPWIGTRTLAFLQYTSGSTRHPKGVQIDHGNLLATCLAFQRGGDLSADDRIGGWLPMYHDFGLVGQLMAPLFVGCPSVLMSASVFLKRPHTWLRLIDRYDLTVSSAPNFAYDLCTRRVTDRQMSEVDLSRWRIAINGSEPIHARTVRAFTDRFAAAGLRSDALRPGYGMAEATLCIAGSAHTGAVLTRVAAAQLERHALVRAPDAARDGDRRWRDLVSSGTAVAGIEIRIVDRRSRCVLRDGLVGEVWVRGESISRGYWRQPDETADVFDNDTGDGAKGFLRTGDLGVLWCGQLYITGRIKELLIIGGRNLYPHDLEMDARSAHESLANGVGAVFTVDTSTVDGPDEEIVVVHECQAGTGGARAQPAAAAIREVLTRGSGVSASVVLVRSGTVPRTTSGKTQRGLTRQLFVAGQLAVLHEDLTPKVRRRYQRPGSEAGGPPGVRQAPQRACGLVGADRFDHILGDPRDEGIPFSYARIADLDGREEFPADICRELDRLGLPAHYVPACHGGELRAFHEMVQTIRVVARRDLTVAIAHAKTFLGACCVWVAGGQQQARALGESVRRGAVVSWALTEPNHGSDLLSGEVTAVPVPGGYRIDGTKWLINNATRADVMCVAARTAAGGGPRGFSLVLVDKHALVEGSYRCLPKVPTHGIRGADISGITFDGAVVPADALVGRVGEGIEIVLKALQVTRTACVALSLGAADHALALAHEFVRERLLYGGRLADLPDARSRLGRSYAMLFVAEAVGAVASRSVHVATDQMSVVSAVVKSFVPAVVDDLLTQCGGLLGARAFLTDVYAHGMFQKVERDHRIVSIFDGSTFVNQSALINQFPSLARRYGAGTDGVAVTAAADLHRDLPELDLSQLALVAKGGCLLVQSLAPAVVVLREQAAAGVLSTAVADIAADLARQCDALHTEMAACRPRSRGMSPVAFELAGRYEVSFAAAAVIQLWLQNHSQADPSSPVWRGGLWLEASLRYLLDGLPARNDAASSTVYEELFAAVDEGDCRAGAPSILKTGEAGRAA